MTISQVITTTDGPGLMLMLGGPEAVKAGLFTAWDCLHRARVDLAQLRANRSTAPEWMQSFYPSSRRYGLRRIARCRAEIAKCKSQLERLEVKSMPTTLDRYNATAARQHQNLMAARDAVDRARAALRGIVLPPLDDIDTDLDGAAAKLDRAMKVMEELE